MSSNSNTEKLKFSLFKEGFILILKKWSSFRMAIDHNPQILTQFADEEKKVLEVNHMLDLLVEDVYNEIRSKTPNRSINSVADILFGFMQDFFDVDLMDESEKDVAIGFARLYEDIEKGNNFNNEGNFINSFSYLEKLKNIDKKFDYSKYSLDFPIVLNEKFLSKEFISKIKARYNSDDEDEEEGESEEDGDKMEVDSEVNNENNNNVLELSEKNSNLNSNNFYNSSNNKTEAEPDDDGFIVVKKGKKY